MSPMRDPGRSCGLRTPRHPFSLWSGAMLAVLAWGLNAPAVIYTYTPTTATENWSAGTNWSAVPVSAADTGLLFAADNLSVLPNSLANTNTNDGAAGAFQLNVLSLQGTGPASGAGAITLASGAGRYLELVSNGAVTPTVNLSAINGTAGLTYDVSSPLTLTNDTTFAGNGTATFNLTGALSGSGALIKAGSSTLNLNADSSASYSGPVSIRGGLLRLNPQFNNAQLPTSTQLGFAGSGGKFTLANATGGPAFTQTLAQVDFESGTGTLDVFRPGGGNTAITVTNWSRSPGAVATFTISGGSNGSTARINLTGQATGFIDAATAFGSGFAWFDAGGYVRGINYGTDANTASVLGNLPGGLGQTGKHVQYTAAGGGTSTTTAAFSNVNVITVVNAASFSVGSIITGTNVGSDVYVTGIAGNTLTLSKNVGNVANGAVITPYSVVNQPTDTVATLRLANNGGTLLLDPGATLTVSSGGIWRTGNTSTSGAVIAGGAGITTGGSAELVFQSDSVNGRLHLATPVLATTTGGLIKAGPATLVMAAPNLFTGGVWLDGGAVELASAETAGVSGPLGASGTIHFYGGALRPTAANTYDYSSRFSTAASQDFRIDTNGQTVTWASDLVSSGGTLTPTGSGTLILTGNNSYSGGSTLSAGTLAVGSDTALGTGPVTFTAAAALRAVGAVPRILGNDVILGAGGSTVTFGGNDGVNYGSVAFTGPVTLATNTSIVGAGQNNGMPAAVAFTGVLGDNGSGRTLSVSGATNGTGQGYIFLLGANTYTGQTSINTVGAAGPVVINTIGDVGSGPSSLGNPADAAAGTINLATGNSSSSAGIIRYIGPATSTNRVLNIGGATTGTNPTNATLDASGSGALTFTSGVTLGSGTSTGTRTLNFTGTSPAANLFAGAIPDFPAGGGLAVTKSGTGTWVLSGANGFTRGLTVTHGRLVLDYATGQVLSNSPANPLTMGGGVLEIKGAASGATTQVFGNMVASNGTGLSTVRVDENGGAGTAVTLGTLTVNTTSTNTYGPSDILFDLYNSPASSVTVGTAINATPGASTVSGHFVMRTATGEYDFAQNGNNVANPLAPVNSATILGLTDGSDTTDYLFTDTGSIGSGSAGAAVAARSLRIAPTLDNQTMTIRNVNTDPASGAGLRVAGFGILFDTGAYDFTVSGGTDPTKFAVIRANNSGNNIFTIHHFGTGKLTFDGTVYLGRASMDALAFDGTGLIDWQGGTNSTEASGRASFNLHGVTLRISGTTDAVKLDTTSTGKGSANLVLNGGGVLELATGDLTRNVASGPTAGALQWRGDGGFSAYGGDRTVNLSAGATLNWGVTAGFVPHNNALVLSSAYADSTLDFQNPLYLGNQQRVVRIGDGTATIDARLSGLLSGGFGGGLIKEGAGTLELTGTNTYVGDTWVRTGTLLVNGDQSAGIGTIVVDPGATFGGSGTLGGLTTIAGVHNPGNSPGLQTFAGDLTYTAGATVNWELAASTLAGRGTSYDAVDLTGAGSDLTFAGATTLNLVLNAAGSAANWSDVFWSTAYTGTGGWLLYDVAGTTTGFASLALAGTDWLDAGSVALSTARPGSWFSLVQDGSDVYLNYNVAEIPEPAAGALLALASLAALRRRGHQA